MTVREVLQREPKLTVAQIMTRTRKQPREVRTEISKLVARGWARETVVVEYLGSVAERKS